MDFFIPILLILLLMACAWKRLPAYDLFLAGAKQGLHVALQVLPNLAAMLCAISLMDLSGLTGQLIRLLSPVFLWLGIPPEVTSLVLIRPLSGSAALGMLENLLAAFGPDDRIGLVASTIMGSSETIFYTICIYMSQSRDRRTGYAVPCSLLGMAAGVWLAGVMIR